MKKFKFLLILLIVLLFSGCTGDYNLTFNKDLSVTEELNVFIENEADNYDRTYELVENAKLDEKDYDIAIIGDQINIVYKKDYDTFEDYYLDSQLYKMLFGKIVFSKDNIGLSIDTESNLKLDDSDNQNIINSYDMEDFRINLEVPFSVKNNNAEIVKDNTYTWILNSEDTYKKISMDFDYKGDSVRNIVLLIIVGVISMAIIGYVAYTVINNKRI